MSPLLLVAAAVAGPWTRDAGEVYAKVAADWYEPTAYVDPLTGQETAIRYFGQQYGAYAEVGLGLGLQASAAVPLSIGTARFADARLLGGGEVKAITTRLGDARGALQLRLLDGVAVAAEAKVPLYALDSVGAGQGVYQPLFPLPGDGQLDLTGWVLAGRGLGHGVWVEGAAGWRHRTEWFPGVDPDVAFVDGVVGRAVAGLGGERGWVAVSGDATVNVVADDRTRQSVAVGVSGGLALWGGLALEARGAFEPWAENAARGWGGGAGVSWTGGR